MRSFANVMPGERRGCVGCHEMHSAAPVSYPGRALSRPPATLTPPPWGARYSLGYVRDIQPILDKHCGTCHQGEGKAPVLNAEPLVYENVHLAVRSYK